MAQYKMFVKTFPATAKHFYVMRILLPWILLAQYFCSAQGQEEHLDFLDDKLIGSITPKDLKSIIREATAEQKENIFKNIFKTLPRILVQYDGVSKNANQKSTSLEILEMAAIINQKNHKSTSTKNETEKGPIEVWISFSTNASNITADLTQILKTATQSNSKFHGTVTTILLHYNRQSLTSVTLPLIKEDIRKSAQLIKTQQGGAFKFGIILDLRNCQSYSEPIKKLAMYEVDLLLLKREESAGTSSVVTVSPTQGEYETCRKKVASSSNTTRTSIGFILPWPVTIDQHDDILQMYLEDGNAIRSYKNWKNLNNITLVMEASLRNKPKASTKTTDKVLEKNRAAVANIDAGWLKKHIVLSKQYFGLSILSHVLQHGDKMKTIFITRMYEKTRKIIIGDVSEAIKPYQDKVQGFVDELAAFKRDIVRVKSGSGGRDIFEDQVPIRVYISMLISNEDTDASTAAISNAGDILIKGNLVYPDTITGVVLNCDSYPLEGELLHHWHQFTGPYIKHAKQRVSTSRGAEVGIILPLELCSRFSSVNETYPNLKMIEFIIFKIYATKEDIKFGVDKLVEKLTKKFQDCRRSTDLYFGRHPEKKRVEFRVSPTDCDAPYSDDIQILANLVRLWEEMNGWAAREKSVITMDTAFDDTFDNELCGWWKVVRDDRNGNVTFEDKKTTALKLYEKLNRDAVNEPELEPPKDINFWLMIIVPTMLFVLFLTASASYLVVRYRSKYIVGKEEADDFFKGMDDKDKIEDESNPINMSKDAGNVTAHSKPYDKEQLEISKGSFTCNRERQLGSGEFGIVCKGSVRKRKAGQEGKEIEVAVKMINDRQGSSQGCNRALKGLLSEIKILSYVGEHKHIITLEGAYTAELRRGRVYVFLELCQMGSLDKHLRSFELSEAEGKEEEKVTLKETTAGTSSTRGNREGEDRYVNLKNKNVLDDALARDLLQWSKEICCGMEYLATKNVVHADLATRNVLLNWKKSAKICDFGLSRRLYDYTNYVKKQQEPMPWRWMAPESLRRLEFNEKTDVWAFGVTLWEIYTLGDQPYPGLCWGPDFVSRLEGGLRLLEPRFKEENMFKIMQSCWDGESARRPSFSDLSSSLMGSKTLYVNVNDSVPE